MTQEVPVEFCSNHLFCACQNYVSYLRTVNICQNFYPSVILTCPEILWQTYFYLVLVCLESRKYQFRIENIFFGTLKVLSLFRIRLILPFGVGVASEIIQSWLIMKTL